MTTVLGARSFDRGNSMLNMVDATDLTRVTASTTYARTGTHSLRIGNQTSMWGRWRMAGYPDTPSCSAWVYLRATYDLLATGITNSNFRFRLTTGEFIDLRWNNATHTYDAYVNGVLFASGTIEIAVNTWFHVQFFVTVANAGNITVLINGHESINTNGDTQPGVAAGADYLYIYGGRGGSGELYDYYDDLVWGYGGLLGSLRVRERVPSSDVSAVWTSSTGGANYTTVDETPQSDVDYNESDTDGQMDELGLTTIDFATLEEAPVALVAWVRAQMAEGTGDSIEPGLKSNGTAVSTASILSTAWQYYFHTADEDPDGGGQPWDATSANAATLTYESVIT